jgi:spore germination cell wall hydrolase CwlJ-like protein
MLAAWIIALAGMGSATASANSPIPQQKPTQESDLQCLALNVYWEGRSEPLEGQRAIAHLTLNRVAHGKFPKTVCDVVDQGVGKQACQFQWRCDSKTDAPLNRAQWARALAVAREALAGKSADPTKGAVYLHAHYVQPSWFSTRQLTTRIAGHVFYR